MQIEVRQEELKPCPFCGAPAELEHGSDHHGTWFSLGCSQHWGAVPNPDKGCIAGRIFYTDTDTPEAEAIAAWNTRYPSEQAGYDRAIAEVVGWLRSGAKFACTDSEIAAAIEAGEF